MKRRIIALAISVVLTISVTGCSPSGESADTATKDGSRSHDLQRYLTDITNSYSSSLSENVALEKAAAVCMKKQGFTYVPKTENSLRQSAEADTTYFLTEFTEPQILEFTKKFGYGFFADQTALLAEFSPASASITRKNEKYVSTLSTSARLKYNEALAGKGTSSLPCLANPLDTKTQKQYSAQVQGLLDDFSKMEYRVSTNPEIRGLTKKWTQCVEAKGVGPLTEFELMSQNLTSLLNWVDTSKMSADERKVFLKKEIVLATIDVKCKIKLGYYKIHSRLLEIEHKEYVSTHKKEIQAAKDLAQQNRH